MALETLGSPRLETHLPPCFFTRSAPVPMVRPSRKYQFWPGRYSGSASVFFLMVSKALKSSLRVLGVPLRPASAQIFLLYITTRFPANHGSAYCFPSTSEALLKASFQSEPISFFRSPSSASAPAVA